MKRIYQDVVSDHGFPGTCESLNQFTSPLEAKTEILYRRMETVPKGEVQVDFGLGACVVGADDG